MRASLLKPEESNSLSNRVLSNPCDKIEKRMGYELAFVS
jgi:hypothetical protein